MGSGVLCALSARRPSGSVARGELEGPGREKQVWGGEVRGPGRGPDWSRSRPGARARACAGSLRGQGGEGPGWEKGRPGRGVGL